MLAFSSGLQQMETGLWDYSGLLKEISPFIKGGQSLGSPFCCITEVVIVHSPVPKFQPFNSGSVGQQSICCSPVGFHPSRGVPLSDA